MHVSNNATRVGVEDIDVVGRTAFPGWNVEQLSVRIDRQPIDTGADRSIPKNRVVVNVEAIDHAGARNILVGDVKLPGDSADGHSSNVADVRNRLNRLNQSIPRINVVDRDRS